MKSPGITLYQIIHFTSDDTEAQMGNKTYSKLHCRPRIKTKFHHSQFSGLFNLNYGNYISNK